MSVKSTLRGAASCANSRKDEADAEQTPRIRLPGQENVNQKWLTFFMSIVFANISSLTLMARDRITAIRLRVGAKRFV